MKPVRVERVRTPWFEVRDVDGQGSGRIVTLNALPPAGHALGLVEHAGVTYYYMDVRVEPTDEDGRRWAELQRS